jgi:hypothetical protein
VPDSHAQLLPTETRNSIILGMVYRPPSESNPGGLGRGAPGRPNQSQLDKVGGIQTNAPEGLRIFFHLHQEVETNQYLTGQTWPDLVTLPREPTFHSFVPRNPSSDQQQSNVETVETVSPLPQSPSKRTMGTYINCSQPRFRPPPRTGGNAFQRYTWRLRTIGTMPQHNNCHRPVIAEQHSTSDSKPRQALERL